MPSALWDRLLASDPPLERLRIAVRATLTVLFSAAILAPLTKAGIISGPGAVLGALMGIWANNVANDPDPRRRRVTAALVAIPGALAVTLAATLERIGPLTSSAGFLAVAFAAVYVRRYGPRWFALGMIALFGVFFALFVQVKLEQLPGTYVALIVGPAVAWVIRFGVVRDDPRSALRAARTAFAARVRLLARSVRAAVDETPGATEELWREAVAFNAAVLPIDTLVAGRAFRLSDEERRTTRLALLDAQLGAERLAIEALAHRADASSPQLLGALDALAAGDFARAGDAGSTALGGAVTEAVEALTRMRAILDDAIRSRETGEADAPPSPMPRPPNVGGLLPTTRQAIQVSVACAIAMIVGTLLPPHQYFWAVLTAFIVYSGTASAAEARARTWGRVVGTAVGVAVGFVVVELVRRHHLLEVELAFVCLFFAMYTLRASYTLFTFFLTALVAMMYDVIGRPTDQLLLARLVETIVGAVSAGVTASFVVPLRTRAVVAVTARTFADKLAAAVRAAVAMLTGDRDGDALDALRAFDAQLQELLARVDPLIRSRFPGVPVDANETVRVLVQCGYRTRDLVRRAFAAPSLREAERAAVRRARDAIEAALRAFETLLEGRPESVPDDVPPAHEAEIAVIHAAAPPAAAAAVHDLRLIAEDVTQLAGEHRALLMPV
jgi:uncharacterized membrane protein YccC